MSDNVSKFDPHPGKSIARRIVLFVLALVLVGGAVTLYVFRDSLNLDAAKRFVRYLNVKTDSAGGSFTFDSHNANQYADLQGGLAVASVSGSACMTRTEMSLPLCRQNWIPPLSAQEASSRWPSTWAERTFLPCAPPERRL